MSQFTFEKSSNRQPVLKEAPKARSTKLGRPQEQEEPRNKSINCYLTESEYKKLNTKLDGRTRSTVMRQLILDYLKN